MDSRLGATLVSVRVRHEVSSHVVNFHPSQLHSTTLATFCRQKSHRYIRGCYLGTRPACARHDRQILFMTLCLCLHLPCNLSRAGALTRAHVYGRPPHRTIEIFLPWYLRLPCTGSSSSVS